MGQHQLIHRPVEGIVGRVTSEPSLLRRFATVLSPPEDMCGVMSTPVWYRCDACDGLRVVPLAVDDDEVVLSGLEAVLADERFASASLELGDCIGYGSGVCQVCEGHTVNVPAVCEIEVWNVASGVVWVDAG